MKTLIIILGILVGYFFPAHSFSTVLLLILLVCSFLIGIVFPDMMNANSLTNKVDNLKVNFTTTISIHKMNTISLWVGVFILFLASTNVIKQFIVNSEISQLGIIFFTFSIGVFLKILNMNLFFNKPKG